MSGFVFPLAAQLTSLRVSFTSLLTLTSYKASTYRHQLFNIIQTLLSQTQTEIPSVAGTSVSKSTANKTLCRCRENRFASDKVRAQQGAQRHSVLHSYLVRSHWEQSVPTLKEVRLNRTAFRPLVASSTLSLSLHKSNLPRLNGPEIQRDGQFAFRLQHTVHLPPRQIPNLCT